MRYVSEDWEVHAYTDMYRRLRLAGSALGQVKGAGFLIIEIRALLTLSTWSLYVFAGRQSPLTNLACGFQVRHVEIW